MSNLTQIWNTAFPFPEVKPKSYFMDVNSNIFLYTQIWFLKFLLSALFRVYSASNWSGKGG